MAKIDKLIVTNVGALKSKYGSAGYSKISKAVARLVAADKKRGLASKLIALDGAVMDKIGSPVKKPGDPAQNKRAIDALCAAYAPDYVMLLGAIDVIPHQDLRNPVPDDDDPIAFGDLPYACSAPYSRNIGDFRAPTRVVGRLPDLTGGTSPQYLIKLLSHAADYTSSPRKVYEAYLGLSARVWIGSTTLSLQNTFGSASELQVSPSAGPKWSAAQLRRRSIFINCHGSPADASFYGQRGNDYPVAHDARYLAGRVAAGSVVAAECCYGAELYDPKLGAGQMGICNTYLADGAFGFFGSSTIAYGPSTGNGAADLICQYFLQEVLNGASLGRAALLARQTFVARASPLDPSDMKTLGQFSLMGDPSIHPVAAAKPALTKTGAYAKALPDAARQARALRRAHLDQAGEALLATPFAEPLDQGSRGAGRKRTATKPKIRAALVAAAAESGVKQVSFASFSVAEPKGVAPKSTAKRASKPASAFHVAVGRPARQDPKVARIVLLIATEVDGRLAALRRLHAR